MFNGVPCMGLYESVYVPMYRWMSMLGPENDVLYLETGAAESCELPQVDSANRMQILCNFNTHS